MKRPSKSFEIALSAISCAVATLFLWLGTISPLLLATGYMVGMFALMVPLSKDFIWGNALAFIAACFLACLCGGFAYIWKLLPFVVFIGLHPLINYLQKRFIKLKFGVSYLVCLPFKALWFDGAMYLCWMFAFEMNVPIDWINQNIFLVTFLGGTLFFCVYDYMIFICQNSVNALVRRIRK